ncbi:MAG: sigma-E factor negative regulatory protein [Hydrogenophaga sp.]|uniref:sigma-E factor negative regulatory protein n=1 Tax=Hydrogenophaga sp. TaxID=1904254 RepID=UPI001DC7C0D3|nr:sigma-E factor negative regulatory protein [Hydrogenophaga sp.]MBX3609102.1 sigma-E factor negative regulatory protein [Hydrogenophaga sp.]
MNTLHPSVPVMPRAEQLSALCDGFLDEAMLAQLLASMDDDPGLHAQWQNYHLIGDVLRGQYVAPGGRQSAGEFLDAVRAQLARPQVAESPQVPMHQDVQVQAANDPVFRWKLVSGVASVVAIAAIGWNVLSIAPTGAPGPTQLAQGGAPVSTVESPVIPVAQRTPQPVLVATPQGKVIRDAALERLLAEHRQHGAMSAFQSSTGFVRNATYDADAR